MLKKYVLSVESAPTPILEATTKFGGQPVWIDNPQWPLSKTTREQMRFIGQFALYPELFGALEARMAYLFMTDGDVFVPDTWLPDGGENAVILQPGFWSGPAIWKVTGPTLFTSAQAEGAESEVVPAEFCVHLTPGTDPDTLDENEFRARDAWDAYCDLMEESKVGGTPAFREGPEYPRDTWRLLAQVSSTLIPGSINFGDGGIGYLFLSQQGQTATFLWQG